MFSELSKVIDTLSKDRGIEREIVVKALEQAFLVTARKKFGIQGEYEARYNADEDTVEIYQYKNVVAEIKNAVNEISLEEGRELDEDVEVGDQLGIRVEPNFTRVDVQTCRQIIFQKVRDAEREILFSEFKDKVGQLVTGIARRYERGNIIVDLGKADAVLSRKEVIPGENFKTGDRIQAFLTDVVMTNRGPEIRLSRTSPMFLVKLFEMEVPEIQDGTIEIRSAAREPGQRAKIAVSSIDKEIDPVGACVGMKGSRVQNVVNELQGEKIDIVKWSDEITLFAKAALAPADIANIMLESDDHSMDVVVDEDQLSLAIGRRGQNVRLAAMLTGHKINIISKSKLQEKIARSVENLLQISSISEAQAQYLVQSGIMALGDLSVMEVSSLVELLEIEESEAQAIIDETIASISEGNVQLQAEEDEEIVSASATPAYKGIIKKSTAAVEAEGLEEDVDESDRFSDAERRLREELASFKLK